MMEHRGTEYVTNGTAGALAVTVNEIEAVPSSSLSCSGFRCAWGWLVPPSVLRKVHSPLCFASQQSDTPTYTLAVNQVTLSRAP